MSKPTFTIRAATSADFAAIEALNAGVVAVTSPMDADRLAHLHHLSSYHRVVESCGDVVAFLLGFEDGAAYDAENYRLFSSLLDRFFYIDRVVVGPAARGQGLGRALYEDVFATARDRGIKTVACEFDIDPPNAASMAFHEALGFSALTHRDILEDAAKGTKAKRVSLQTAPVPDLT